MNIRDIAAMAPCGVALAASLMLAGPASATIYSLTYKGVVTSALDQTGEFGAGANLVGQAFTAHVVFNDGPTSAAPWGDVYYDYLQGDGAESPVTASILLNGVTKTFGATYGYDQRQDNTLNPNCMFSCTDSSFQQHAEDRYTVGLLSTLNYINLGGFSSNGTISGLAHTAPIFTNPPVDLYAYLTLNEQNILTLDRTRDASVSVRITSITDDRAGPAGPVPEPGVWALMVLGFGGMGAMLRRRRAVAAPV